MAAAAAAVGIACGDVQRAWLRQYAGQKRRWIKKKGGWKKRGGQVRTEHHFGVEVVHQRLGKGALYRHAAGEHAQVVAELVVGGNNDALTTRLILRPSSSPKDLLHIQQPYAERTHVAHSRSANTTAPAPHTYPRW